jgi:hypothetical protein
MDTETLRAFCVEAGVKYEGVFKSFVRQDGSIYPTQLLWTSKRTRSSYCLPAEGVTVAEIIEHTEIMDSNFAGAETVRLTHAAGRTYHVENF